MAYIKDLREEKERTAINGMNLCRIKNMVENCENIIYNYENTGQNCI